MKNILNRLTNHENLSKNEAKVVLVKISKGDYNSNEIAAFLTVYLMRSITIEELIGFKEALLELCLPIDLSDFNTIDLCGTGGDGKDTFNISTLSSFICAGSDVKVAKHGNYGVSSACGSSNVLDFLGVKFSNDQDFLIECIDKAGICILHAPLFHPAMKNVAPIRKKMGVKTFFNILGPMVNPSLPKNQMVGVFNLELLRLYSYLYQKTDKKYSIIHSLDGYDEVSLTGKTKICTNSSEIIIDANYLKVPQVKEHQISGGNSIESSSKVFMDIINGNGSEAQNNVVCANAGIAISTYKGVSIQQGFELAQESLNSKRALNSLKSLQKISKK
jgi:anthranilate phosphoribosyltransferase